MTDDHAKVIANESPFKKPKRPPKPHDFPPEEVDDVEAALREINEAWEEGQEEQE